MTPQGIIIHHSLTHDGKSVDYDAIRRYHMEEKGWNDIGYHFLIEQTGDVISTITGRDVRTIGAHCIGKNDHIGICVVGNYDVGCEVLSAEKMDALVALTVNLMSQFNLPLESIHRHSEYAPKTCPGSGFPWEDYLARVQELAP